MKKFIAIIMLFALLLSLAACGEKPADGAEASASDTAPIETEAPEPTEEPVVTPEPEATPEPTPEPTATPEPAPVPDPVQYAFEDCAEVVARLPWGNGENEVYRHTSRPYGPGDEPVCFCVNDGKVYILDRFQGFVNDGENSMIVYDLASGEVSRLYVFDTDSRWRIESEFAIDGNRIITPHMIFDTETGEYELLQSVYIETSALECVKSIRQRDGEWYMYVSEASIVGTTVRPAPLVTEYKLDETSLLWKPMRRYLRSRQHTVVLDESFIGLDRGTERGEDAYIGYDAEGCHYVATYENRSEEEFGYSGWIVVTKYSPEGNMLSFTELCTDGVNYYYPETNWGYNHPFKVDDDGTVWYMMLYDEEVVIYRISI